MRNGKGVKFMPSEKKKFVTLLGQCPECGQPVTEGQAFVRSYHAIRHALCEFDPA